MTGLIKHLAEVERETSLGDIRDKMRVDVTE